MITIEKVIGEPWRHEVFLFGLKAGGISCIGCHYGKDEYNAFIRVSGDLRKQIQDFNLYCNTFEEAEKFIHATFSKVPVEAIMRYVLEKEKKRLDASTAKLEKVEDEWERAAIAAEKAENRLNEYLAQV